MSSARSAPPHRQPKSITRRINRHGVRTCASGCCYVAKAGFCLVHLVHLVHLVYLVGLVQPNRRDTPDRPNRPNEQDLLAEAQAPAPRLRLRSYGTARVVAPGFGTGYPGGGSADSSAEGPRSVELPESVTGGGDPDVGVTRGAGLRSGVGGRGETGLQ